MMEFKRGTPGFGLFLGMVFVLAGGLVMWIGIWRTLLLVVLFAAGYFLGAVKNKKEVLKNTVNRLIPEKKEEVIDFRKEVVRTQDDAAAQAPVPPEAEDRKEEEE